MVFEPMLCTSLKIKFCAPSPKDITKIIAVMPITMPRIVRIDLDLLVLSPMMAVLKEWEMFIINFQFSIIQFSTSENFRHCEERPESDEAIPQYRRSS